MIQKKKQLKNGITVSDDLIWQDRQGKKNTRMSCNGHTKKGRNRIFTIVNYTLTGFYTKMTRKVKTFSSFFLIIDLTE